jgi:two-component system sensor histidine kinase EvgS
MFNGLAYLICTYAVSCHAGPFSDAEKSWIDARPIIKFSIHEKYAPYLNATDNLKDIGVFKSLLTKMQECTGQEFIPIWRNSDQDVLRQLAVGEVDFIIDPPTITSRVLQVGTLSESIFWGHDAIITKTSAALANSNHPLKLAYFDRGYENPPSAFDDRKVQSQLAPNLIDALIQNDIEALVMPVRLAQYLIQVHENEQLKLDGLYSREPFAYRWLISHQNEQLHQVLNHFLSDLDPIASRNLFAFHEVGSRSHQSSMIPWLSSIALLMIGTLLTYRLHKKYFHEKKAAGELRHSKEVAEKANAAKSAFLATMSHEIRTPMNAILGVQELLLGNEQFPKKDKHLLKSAQASAESLLGMLNQVLDISKIEAGKLTLNLEPCQLGQLVTDIDAAFSTVAKQQQLTLNTSIDPRIAEVLMIDSLRLRQVLQNLLSNAIKFTSQGEIYFAITVLADDHAGQLIEFRVIDTGVGMGSEQIEVALQAFEQLPSSQDASFSAQKRGTGLGLTITNHLVTSMNSHLYFESAPGFGSNVHFSVAFPRSSLAASNTSFFDSLSQGHGKLISKRSSGGNQTLHALVVEDHPASRQILSLQLEALGIQTQVCENAQIALELFLENRFDLILTDQSMPGMQGSDLAKHIRSLGNRDLVIIGVTADIYALESRHQFLSSGMNGVLIKPLSLGALENELMRYFDSSNQICAQQEPYSFDSFANLIKNDQSQIVIILEEIQRVHDETLAELITEAETGILNEARFQSLVHRVKGGAQLLQADQFVKACQALEPSGPLSDRKKKLIALLNEQNKIIGVYKLRYQPFKG